MLPGIDAPNQSESHQKPVVPGTFGHHQRGQICPRSEGLPASLVAVEIAWASAKKGFEWWVFTWFIWRGSKMAFNQTQLVGTDWSLILSCWCLETKSSTPPHARRVAPRPCVQGPQLRHPQPVSEARHTTSSGGNCTWQGFISMPSWSWDAQVESGETCMTSHIGS